MKEIKNSKIAQFFVQVSLYNGIKDGLVKVVK
jgi:hypothetical protein